MPVEKTVTGLSKEKHGVADASNSVFLNTAVQIGVGTVVIVCTAKDTACGENSFLRVLSGRLALLFASTNHDFPYGPRLYISALLGFRSRLPSSVHNRTACLSSPCHTSRSISAVGTAAQGRVHMNRHFYYFHRVAVLGFGLLLAAVILAQRMPDKTLVVNGRTTGTAVREIDGRSYVDLENLAQLTNGVVTFEANRVVLTIPEASSDATSPHTTHGLSTNFVNGAIASLAEMKEWQGALGTMVTFGLATGAEWAHFYQDQVTTSLAQATAAASTDADRNALQLLDNEFANLASWASNLFAERQALDGARTVDPNSLKNDAVLTKITDCGRLLSAMLVSGAIVDDSSCH